MIQHKPVCAFFFFPLTKAAAFSAEALPTPSRGAEFRRTGPTYIIARVANCGKHFGRAVRRASPVLLPVRGDDVVAGVLQLVAHEAPGEDVRLRVGLQIDAQEQTLSRAHLDGFVVFGCRIDESFSWEMRQKERKI